MLFGHSYRDPTNRLWTIPRHTAQKQHFDVQIHYSHHPRAGEYISVLRTVRHAGMAHFVIDSADDTRSLLPKWMTEPHAASLPLVESATLSLQASESLPLNLSAAGTSAWER